MSRNLTKNQKPRFNKIRLSINYYHLTTCVAAIALALVMSMMAKAQDESATNVGDTNQLSNPVTRQGTSSGTSFSDSEKAKHSVIKKEDTVRGQMQKAHDSQATGATPTPTPTPH